VNPIEAYISEQRRALEEQFPARYDSADSCITDELASFLTYVLIGLLDTIEHERDPLYQTEHSIVPLDVLALMFHEVRHAAWHGTVAGSGTVNANKALPVCNDAEAEASRAWIVNWPLSQVMCPSRQGPCSCASPRC